MPSRWTLRCQGGGATGQRGNGPWAKKEMDPFFGAEISTIIRHHSFIHSFLPSFLRSFMHVRFQFLRSSCLILSSCLHHACFYFHHSFFCHCWRVIVHQSFFVSQYSLDMVHHSLVILHHLSVSSHHSSVIGHHSSLNIVIGHHSSVISCHFSLINRHLSFKISSVIIYLPIIHQSWWFR